MNPLGLLLVDKPEGPTSHDVIEMVRRALGTRRVGHTGTLDPFASGLLIVCLGWATRLAEYLTDLPKAYDAVVRLGARTDTDDRTGAVVSGSDAWRSLDAAQVRRAVEAQVGEIEQVPPAYSARKVAGRRAYAVARGGGSLELRPKRVTISRLELCGYTPPDVKLEIECSGGTYIRAIARDLGEALGVGGHLTDLRRTRIGEFSVAGAMPIGRETPRAEIEARLLPAAAAVKHLPRADLDARAREALRQGRAVEWAGEGMAGPVAVFVEDELVAIAGSVPGRLEPKKVFGAAA